jgi:hypothetical protein
VHGFVRGDRVTIGQPTPFSDLNAVLADLLRDMRAALGEDLVALWLQGSFAVGDFDEHSDVDWIAAVRQELSAAQVEALQAAHGRVYDLASSWAQHLEGSYMPLAVLGDLGRVSEPVWHLNHGARSLERSNHGNTCVVRWVLRAHGVPLAGPRARELVAPVPVEALRAEMLAHARRWGAQVLADPSAEIGSRFFQTFAVLHFSRILHDLHTGRVGSKRAGAARAKALLGAPWEALIDRAWLGRPDPARSSREPAGPVEVQQTVDFVREALRRMEAEEGDWGAEAGLSAAQPPNPCAPWVGDS